MEIGYFRQNIGNFYLCFKKLCGKSVQLGEPVHLISFHLIVKQMKMFSILKHSKVKVPSYSS